MNIIIDGDACPVILEVIQCARQHDISVMIVRSYSHFSTESYPSHVSVKYVDGGLDAVDFKVVQIATSGDIVITQDYGLASLLLDQKVHVLHHLGYVIDQLNINRLLVQRYESAQLRKGRKKVHLKGPKKFTLQDRENFRVQLNDLLNRIHKKS